MNKNNLPKYFSPNKLLDLQTYHFALDSLCYHYFIKVIAGNIDWYSYVGWEFHSTLPVVIIKYSYEDLIDREHPTWESAECNVPFEMLTKFWLETVETYNEINKQLDKDNG